MIEAVVVKHGARAVLMMLWKNKADRIGVIMMKN